MNTVDALIRDGLLASVLGSPLPEVWIAIRTDGLPGSIVIGDGTRENPWDGSTALKLDLILGTKLTEGNVIIHFGPGLFRTGGSRVGQFYEKWRPLSGWKIVGSGQFQTTLLLTVYDEPTNGFNGVYGYWMIYSRDLYLEGFELADPTLDCGMDDQPLPPDAKHSWSQTMCAAFHLAGRNISIKRVRVVNFGTRGSVFVDGVSAGSLENYPAIMSGGKWRDPTNVSFNNVVEDCIFEQPYHSNGRECTPIHSQLGGSPASFGIWE